MYPIIEDLENWAKENNMKINIDKTVYQIFSSKHKIEEPDIKIKNNQ
jgi:ribosomal protein L20A (L18A)